MVKIGRAGGKTSNRETPDQIGRVGISAHVIGSYWTSNISRKSYDDRIYDSVTGTSPNCYLRSSHVSSSSFATFCAWRLMNPLTSTCCVSPSTGEDHHEDRRSPFPTKSKNTEIDSNKYFSENDIVCTAQVQLEMLNSRLPMMTMMMVMMLFKGGIQHDTSIHLIIRYWNDFHSKTYSICFSMYLGFTWCPKDISFAPQVIPVLNRDEIRKIVAKFHCGIM